MSKLSLQLDTKTANHGWEVFWTSNWRLILPNTPNENPNATREEAISNAWGLSVSGFVKHGEEIFVPWGKVEDWNLILSVYHVGMNEIGSQKDNALMEFTVSERILGNDSGWEITAHCAFRAWNANRFISPGMTVKYLMVAA